MSSGFSDQISFCNYFECQKFAKISSAQSLGYGSIILFASPLSRPRPDHGTWLASRRRSRQRLHRSRRARVRVPVMLRGDPWQLPSGQRWKMRRLRKTLRRGLVPRYPRPVSFERHRRVRTLQSGARQTTLPHRGLFGPCGTSSRVLRRAGHFTWWSRSTSFARKWRRSTVRTAPLRSTRWPIHRRWSSGMGCQMVILVNSTSFSRSFRMIFDLRANRIAAFFWWIVLPWRSLMTCSTTSEWKFLWILRWVDGTSLMIGTWSCPDINKSCKFKSSFNFFWEADLIPNWHYLFIYCIYL